MTYEAARGRLRDILAGLAISAPVPASIRRVYLAPPEAVQDLPAAVLYGSSGVQRWTLGSARAEVEHEERVRLLTSDEDLELGIRVLYALREAFAEALVSEAGLAGHAVLRQLSWQYPSAVALGARTYLALDCSVTMLLR